MNEVLKVVVVICFHDGKDLTITLTLTNGFHGSVILFVFVRATWQILADQNEPGKALSLHDQVVN